MKILYIITQADGGGAQKYTLALAKHFHGCIAAGHSTLRDEPSGSDSKSDEANKLFEDAIKEGVQTYKIKHLKRNISPWHDFWAILEIKNLVKNLKPDIVHLNSSKAGFLGSIAGKLAGSKVVFTAHGFRFLEPLSFFSRAFYLAAEKLAGFFRDYIIAVSETDAQAAVQNGLISENKIQTIYNGIPKTLFLARDEARSQMKIPQNVLAFATLANFYKTKGVDILVEAVSLLPKEIKDKSVFVVFGEGTERKILEDKIKKFGLRQTVRLPGQVENAKVYLKGFDAYVLPSRKEGFPFAILEALQAGLPIVATRVGGVPEAVGNAGMLVEPENPKNLSEAITMTAVGISRRDQLLVKLSANALERSGLFTEERMFSETEKIYKKILG